MIVAQEGVQVEVPEGYHIEIRKGDQGELIISFIPDDEDPNN